MVETRAQHRRRVASLTWNKVESNQDVFQDVLSRLPVRSIRSFKTVNRYWHASVSNKHFATIHLAQSRKKPSYIACPRVDKAMKLYLLKPGKFNYRHHATVDPPGRSADHHMHMIASFNGLVCCINQLYDEHEVDYQIWICNPSTEETLLLPQGRPSVWTEPSIGVAYGPDIMSTKFSAYSVLARETLEKGIISTNVRCIHLALVRGGASALCFIFQCMFVSVHTDPIMSLQEGRSTGWFLWKILQV
uniref:F-box domain-containing protein n=1 Tax=Brassica oleracea TaxID=3712 RepID=A0A3P6F7P3_BRAOL|nr:unnamed protein product [Brassica oleracea]